MDHSNNHVNVSEDKQINNLFINFIPILTRSDLIDESGNSDFCPFNHSI
jgi:hypothetical protein